MKEISVYTIVSDNIIPGERVFVMRERNDAFYAPPIMLSKLVNVHPTFPRVHCWDTIESLNSTLYRTPALASYLSEFPIFLDEPRAEELANEMVCIGAKVVRISIPVTTGMYKHLVEAARIRGAYRFLETMQIMATSFDF